MPGCGSSRRAPVSGRNQTLSFWGNQCIGTVREVLGVEGQGRQRQRNEEGKRQRRRYCITLRGRERAPWECERE